MKRDTTVSPYFNEDAYKGQDVVHQGIRIPLSMKPEETLTKFSRRAQRIINEGRQGFEYSNTISADLIEIRKFWFDMADVTFPSVMDAEGHYGITVRHNGVIDGGILLRVQGANLFVHQLVSSESGKGEGVPTLLLWEAVKRFHGKFHAIDLGVSYNPKRYEFFKNFTVETYPIILKRPFYTPVIRLSPFRTFRDLKGDGDVVDWGKEKLTFLPRGSYAIQACLEHLKKDSERREVIIVKTFGSDFITGCVTRAIERAGYTWTLRTDITGNTRAVLAIHEFGMPVFQARDMEILDKARTDFVPVIEDCAWRSSKVWEWSDYAIFSLQKMVDVNYGGILQGVHLDDDFLWSIGCLDTVKRERASHEIQQDEGKIARIANWSIYDRLVRNDSMTPDDCYDYAGAISRKEWVPTVYMQRFKDDAETEAIVARLEEFGIQAGHYHGEPVVYLPIHQNMSAEEVEYMFAVVRGYFNLCRDYGKKV